MWKHVTKLKFMKRVFKKNRFEIHMTSLTFFVTKYFCDIAVKSKISIILNSAKIRNAKWWIKPGFKSIIADLSVHSFFYAVSWSSYNFSNSVTVVTSSWLLRYDDSLAKQWYRCIGVWILLRVSFFIFEITICLLLLWIITYSEGISFWLN